MKILFLLLFLTSTLQAQNFDFPSLYKNDLKNLEENRFMGDVLHLQEFKQFEKTSLKNYISASQITDSYHFTKWSSTSKNEKLKSIVRFEKCIPIDEKNCLIFIGYEFTTRNNKTYQYISVEDQGLMEYAINNKEYHIAYVSIILGLDKEYFDTKTQIKSLFSKN
ncbi:hypothetical protein [Flavobacterium pedocola]